MTRRIQDTKKSKKLRALVKQYNAEKKRQRRQPKEDYAQAASQSHGEDLLVLPPEIPAHSPGYRSLPTYRDYDDQVGGPSHHSAKRRKVRNIAEQSDHSLGAFNSLVSFL